jgi:hypothetical protein
MMMTSVMRWARRANGFEVDVRHFDEVRERRPAHERKFAVLDVGHVE